MEAILNAISGIIIVIGTLFSGLMGTPLEPSIIGAGYFVAFVTLILIPAMFLSWMWDAFDTRPSRLLRDVRDFEKMAQNARNQIKAQVKELGQMFEESMSLGSTRYYYAYFVPQMNGKDVELVFHTDAQSDAARVVVPVKLFDKGVSAKLAFVNDVRRETEEAYA